MRYLIVGPNGRALFVCRTEDELHDAVVDFMQAGVPIAYTIDTERIREPFATWAIENGYVVGTPLSDPPGSTRKPG